MGLYIFLLVLVILALVYLVFYFQKPKRVQVQQTTFTSKYTDIDGYRIHYFQEGSGPNLVLLHGLAASNFTWRFLIQSLAEKYTVTAIDILGFGLSDKPRNFSYDLDAQTDLLVKLFNKLEINQARLIGSSMGGALSLWLAKCYPDRFLEVVAISPAIDPSHIRFNFQRLSLMGSLFKPLVTKSLVKRIMKSVINKPELINESTIESYYSPYADNPAAIESFFKSISILRDNRFPLELKKLSTPVLMLWGRHDHVVTYKIGEKIHQLIPQIQLVIHPTAGHHIMEDDPDWVLDQVRVFFDTKSD